MSEIFYGGIKINKTGASHGKAPLRYTPDAIAINIAQQAGGGTVPCIKEGDTVKKGQVIATSERLAFLHSPVSGSVFKLLEKDGTQHIVLKSDGNDTLCQPDPFTKPIEQLTFEEITEKIRRMGVVGTFSGFPTHIKLIASRNKAFCLVVNCVQSDPYGSFVREIIKSYPEKLIIGARILARAIGVKSVVFALEKNERKAYLSLLSVMDSKEKLITIERFAPKYPLGEERNLLCAITNKEVPAGRATHDIGYTVFSAETVLNVYRACAEGVPVTEKYITVSGNSAVQKANLIVPIGTSLGAVVRQCGGVPDGSVCLYGGSINGTVADLENGCVTKSTALLLVSKAKEKKTTHCIRCGKCIIACPMRLAPYTFINGEHRAPWVKLCDMCGCCEYVCPAGVNLLDIINEHKKEAAQ